MNVDIEGFNFKISTKLFTSLCEWRDTLEHKDFRVHVNLVKLHNTTYFQLRRSQCAFRAPSKYYDYYGFKKELGQLGEAKKRGRKPKKKKEEVKPMTIVDKLNNDCLSVQDQNKITLHLD